MRVIVESERHIGKDPFQFLSTNIIPNGSFVSIGYFNDHEISFGPRTRKYNIKNNDEKLTEYIDNLPDGKFKDALVNFQNSPKYIAAMESGKSAPFNIEGDVHIIKISRFIVNWKNNSAFASFYGNRRDAEQAVRVKHGFGNDEDSYAEDDWRHKYKGVGSMPLSGAKGKQGNPYRSMADSGLGDSGFYSHAENPSKISIRQVGNPKASMAKPIWLFVDADGKVSYLDNGLMAWLQYAYKQNKVKEEIQEISQEEKDFLADLQAIKNYDKKEITLLLDNILYMTGTSVTSDGKKDPFIWLNDDIIKQTYPYIDETELNKIIDKCVKKSKRETSNMNESFKVRMRKPLMERKNKVNTNKKLYESIMSDVSNIIKHKLK